ncbi:hypothetical protein C0Q70_19371 [Pomacea canaliculata]|uniref:HSF-type DNA-binding domain-containing protein n=1 Tax=Pomacea canaliculata TaxID=400727 RepID=A0A2T7NJ54_POMCA|nr:hypothetical protein C0Q70_19371 [Pomacea canaliculata]
MILFLNAAQTMNSPPRLSSDSMVMRFPARLWRIVNSCTSGAISWGPNGKTVRVLRHKFEKEYLLAVSKPFKTSKFESFVRQLNHYGFKKITNPIMLDESKEEAASLSEYRNSLFTRDRPEMIAFLHRSCRRSGPEKGARRQRPKPREATLCPQSSSQPAGFNAEPSSNNSSILLHPLLRPDKPADFNNCKSNCSVGAQPGPTCSVLKRERPATSPLLHGHGSEQWPSSWKRHVEPGDHRLQRIDSISRPIAAVITAAAAAGHGRGHQGKSYLLRPTDSGNKFDGSDVSLIPATSSSILMNVTLTSASSAVEPSVLTGNFQTLMPVSSHVDTLQGSPWICFSDRPAASSSKKSSFDDVEQSAPAELDSVVKASWAPSSDRHQSQSSVLTPCSSVEEAIYIDTLIDCQAGLKPRDSVNASLLSTSTWDPCLRSLTLLRVDLPDTGSLSPTRELIQVSEIKD